MTRIKFCGMTRPADAATAADLGASHVGVIFAESPRRVTPEAARRVFEAARDLRRVGVFGRTSLVDILHVIDEVTLDVIQLHSRLDADSVSRLREGFDGSIWVVVPVAENGELLDRDAHDIVDTADALVLDTSLGGKTGGSGRPFDWTSAAPAAKAVARNTPIVLAGGLNPVNVAAAIAAIGPAIVDVSSGVERSPGIKDPDLMHAFALAVGSASIV